MPGSPTAFARRLVRWLGRHRAVTVLTALALVFSSLGLVQFALLVRDRPLPQAEASANLDGLNASVSDAGWLSMDMPQTGGYQMPPAMNPGMPAAGDERLAITVTVLNTTGTTGSLHAAQEFTVRTAKDGKTWTPISNTFGDLPRLAAGNGVSGLLYYDLPSADISGQDPIWVDWSRPSGTRALEIPLPGQAPAHAHNP
ncbi:MAG TPA: hypothetical protein VJT31_33040 [Rugosimonospora sp.]|nr:hypothetical protein [Rugosimonospora sp.]